MSDTKKSSRKPVSKEQWAKANDAGPHLATLPSGVTVRIRIPDTGALIRSGRLPDRLREIALLIAGHPEGAEGFFGDVISSAIVRGEREAMAAAAVDDGMQLGNVLVSEMLVEPEVTVEEVEGGLFHELDVKMLLEFAERRRSVDAAGNHLPIVTLDEWATFRHLPERREGAGNGAAAGDPSAGALAADPAGGAV